MRELDDFYQRNKDADWSDIRFKKELIEIIFRNKPYFLIHKLEGDLLSEFYLGFFKNLGEIMEKYEPDRCSFSTYLRMRVDLQIKTSMRDFYRKSRKTDYADSIQYSDSDWEVKDLPLPYSAGKDENTEILHKYRNAFLSNHTIPTAKKILVLALKSQAMLTCEQIDRIKELTGMDKEEIDDLFFKARQINEKRKKRLEKEVERRNELFFKRTQSFNEMLQNSDNPELFQSEVNRFLKSDYAWKKKIQFIKKNGRQDLTNREVADLLGLTQAQVGSVLRKVQRFVAEELPSIESAEAGES